ncbi:MAG: radical SAM protein [Candidatus Omnitrophica bacterium]|nr:radical SAM protein [Candidatus Omnitrophota bacterium]
MKIFILNPAYGKDFCKSARWFCRSRGRVQRHPDYLCEAIAVLEKEGHECRFIDGAAKNISRDQTAGLLKGFRPDMVVIQATTPSIYSDLEYARLAKETLGEECLTVMVGAHVSAEPDDTLKKCNELDIAARREYDYTLKDIASGKAFAAIEGISYRNYDKIAHNPDRAFIDDLDALPFPAWHHIDPYDYHDAGKLYPFITLMGGRGCCGRCSFCLFPQVMYGNLYRAKSPKRFVDEIEYDLALSPFLKEIMFEDDTLISNAQEHRIRAVCEEILKRGLKITWSANGRADLVDKEVFRLMKSSGCRMLCVGYEFGDQSLLNAVRKGTTVERMRQFTAGCRDAGISVNGCFMFGGPGETRETAARTIEFAKSLPIDTAQFSGVCAYPGTDFYKWCVENRCLVTNDWPKWVDKNLEQRTIISLPGLSDDEINKMIDRGLKEFYLRPGQMLKIARKIRSWADVKTKLYGLKSFSGYFLNRPGHVKKSGVGKWDDFWKRHGHGPFSCASWSKLRLIKVLDRYVKEGISVLDAGCGSGFFSAYFVSKGCEVFSLDNSQQSLKATRENTGLKCAAYLDRDLTDEKLSTGYRGKFNIIFTDGLFEHLSAAEQDKVLLNFIRMKKPDGKIVTFAPNIYTWWTLIRPFFMLGIREKPVTMRDLTAMHTRNGCRVIEAGGINVLPFRYSPESILGRYVGMLLFCVAVEKEIE